MRELVCGSRPSGCRCSGRYGPMPGSTRRSPRRQPTTKEWARDEALVEILRGRLEGLGPATPRRARRAARARRRRHRRRAGGARSRGIRAARAASRPAPSIEEWCERRLLARIHRYTVNRLRAEIEPVAARDFLRFLFEWQRVSPDARMEGPDALDAVIGQLEGFEAPAGAWESEILPARLADYEPAWLDDQCLAGRVAWARLRPRAARARGSDRGVAPVRSTPITLLAAPPRAALGVAVAEPRDGAAERRRARRRRLHPRAGRLVLRRAGRGRPSAAPAGRGGAGRTGGARPRHFRQFRRVARAAGAVRQAPSRAASPRRRCFGMEDAGRWALARRARAGNRPSGRDRRACRPHAAAALRRRVLAADRARGGVAAAVARAAARLSPARSARRDPRRALRRRVLPASNSRCPTRSGLLREMRRKPASGTLVSLSGADPLNLVGILTPGPKLAA